MLKDIKTKITLDHRIQIVNDYSSGKSVLSISKEYPYNYNMIYTFLKKCNIEIRGNDFTARKFEYNINFFDTIDSEEKAYWFGFLCADGYITKRGNTHQLGCALSTIDKSHLEKLSKSLDSDVTVKDYISNQSYGERTEYSRFIISNNHICESLMSKGMTRRKTDTLIFPKEHIPNHLIRHFIRGYFDGDGCLTSSYLARRDCKVYSVKILGTLELLTGLHDEFSKVINFKFSPRKRHEELKNNYTLEIGGRLQVEQILKYLYDDCNIYLDRKFELYKEFFSYHEERVKSFRRIVHRY